MEINGPSVFSSPVTSVSRRLHACFVQWIKLQNKFIWNYVVVEFVLFSFSLAISCYLMLIICSIYDAQRQLICIILLLYRTDLCCTKAKLISMTYSSRTHRLREMLFSLYRLAMLCGKVSPNKKQLLRQFACYVVSVSATWGQQISAIFSHQSIYMCHITTAGCDFLQGNSFKEAFQSVLQCISSCNWWRLSHFYCCGMELFGTPQPLPWF